MLMFLNELTVKYDDHRFGMRTEVDKKGLLVFKTEALAYSCT